MHISTIILSSVVFLTSAISYAEKSPKIEKSSKSCEKGYKSGEKKEEQSNGGKSGGYRVVTAPKHVSTTTTSSDRVYVSGSRGGYFGGYAYGRGYYPYGRPGVYSPATTTHVFFPETELGIRASAGVGQNDQDTTQGLGLYLRSHVRRLGFEVSVDGATVLSGNTPVANRASLLGAGMLYLTPEESPLRVYGLLGGGLTAIGTENSGPSQTLQTLQAGVGADITIGPKTKLQVDVRALSDFEVVDNAFSPIRDTVVGNVGISFTF